MRRALFLSLIVAGAFGLGFLSAWHLRAPAVTLAPATTPVAAPVAAAPPPERLDLLAATFTDLPGWREDGLAAALAAYRESCAAIQRLPRDRAVAALGEHSAAHLGTAGDWSAACAAAQRVPAGDDAAARVFFEAAFQPWAAASGERQEGLLTGYYEAALRGSRKRSAQFAVPLYGRPQDLIELDLGEFREDLAGRRLAGRVEGRRLVPYPDRAAIEAGALAGKRLEVLWVDDPIAAFFLQIQGSGRVELPDGQVVRVGYAGGNGQPYFAIGKELVARGALTKEQVSMQSIRRWLEANPEERPAVLAKNPSFVFFRLNDGPGPLGTQGVPLTPGRSLAVDRRFLPLGVPVFLAGAAPAADETAADQAFRRLVITQDTGGAINGALRGDVFWGHGAEAEAVAGRMKHPARWWVLAPKHLAPRDTP